uniref:Uncharacterized protein n=1 Tax=Rhizophora mucronata TaxID=61149 RepID=A0A2P2NY69_RHIMU
MLPREQSLETAMVVEVSHFHWGTNTRGRKKEKKNKEE